MAKRFCDTEIWQKDWFLNLSDKNKLLTKFLFDNCDCAGIYEISWRMLKVFFNSEISKKDFEEIKQIRFINENTIFIEDFILFQCGISSLNDLNPNNNAHKGIIKRLEKYNLNLGAKEGLIRGSLAPQETEKEKEKEKEKDNLLSFGSFLSSINSEEEKTVEEEKQENLNDFYGEFKNVYLPKNRYDILSACILNDTILNELINELSEAIERHKKGFERYDEKYPDAHYLHLKAFWKFRRENPEKFIHKKDADTGGSDRKALMERVLHRLEEDKKKNECK